MLKMKIADKTNSLAVRTATDKDGSAIRTLAAVRELDPEIRAAANEIELGRRLPLHIVHDMQRAGVFRMSMPRAWGGSELDLPSQLEVIEALSIADASVGWCAMIGTDGGTRPHSSIRPWRAKCILTSIWSPQSPSRLPGRR